jgi:predicted glycosyltransferase
LRVWFDILTPKQVMFFKPAIDLFNEAGHESLCTSREYREVVELSKIKRLHLKIVGRHGGAGKYEKLCESANRIFELAHLVKQFEPDVAISFSSPEAARVAFGLGVSHIGFNDSPHAEAVARLTIPLIDHLFSPWVIPYSAWNIFGIPKTRITRYRALDPVVWLKRSPLSSSSLTSNLINEIGLETSKKNVLIRLEETKASYIADKKIENSISMVDAIVDNLSVATNIIILCRYEDQITELTKRYEGKAYTMQNVLDGTLLISLADLFIGAGGTMTAEASLLGKPTISIAPVRFYIEKYLIKSGLVKRAISSRDLVRLSNKMLLDKQYTITQENRARRILDSMDDPIDKMFSFITNPA